MEPNERCITTGPDSQSRPEWEHVSASQAAKKLSWAGSTGCSDPLTVANVPLQGTRREPLHCDATYPQ